VRYLRQSDPPPGVTLLSSIRGVFDKLLRSDFARVLRLRTRALAVSLAALASETVAGRTKGLDERRWVGDAVTARHTISATANSLRWMLISGVVETCLGPQELSLSPQKGLRRCREGQVSSGEREGAHSHCSLESVLLQSRLDPFALL
jgi:hypothetical protein